jgi:CheY-like chemotaxis protein
LSSPAGASPLDILLVEDNPGDVVLTRQALAEQSAPHRLSVAADGEEALAFLRRHGRHAVAPRPDLILLDLNLPRKDGRAVLTELKSDAALKRIPVVVLTSSAADEDVVKCYDLHANCYITKPVDFSRFVDVIGTVMRFWFSVATLPPKS